MIVNRLMFEWSVLVFILARKLLEIKQTVKGSFKVQMKRSECQEVDSDGKRQR